MSLVRYNRGGEEKKKEINKEKRNGVHAKEVPQLIYRGEISGFINHLYIYCYIVHSYE
jgi:hypothetical protein